MSQLSEHDLQASIIVEVDLRAAQSIAWKYIYHVPNGGHRDIRVAVRLKAEGVRKGVPDLHWPIARGRYHGLYMELKVDDNPTTADQKEWLQFLANEGHCVCVVRDDPAEAIRILDWYYNGAQP